MSYCVTCQRWQHASEHEARPECCIREPPLQDLQPAERVLIPGLAAYLLLPRLFKDKASIPFWQMFLAS